MGSSPTRSSSFFHTVTHSVGERYRTRSGGQAEPLAHPALCTALFQGACYSQGQASTSSRNPTHPSGQIRLPPSAFRRPSIWRTSARILTCAGVGAPAHWGRFYVSAVIVRCSPAGSEQGRLQPEATYLSFFGIPLHLPLSLTTLQAPSSAFKSWLCPLLWDLGKLFNFSAFIC